MKRMILSVLCIVGLSVSLTGLGGCEESGRNTDKRARLVFTENLTLKEQVESLEKEVQNQKNLLAGCEKEKVRIKQQAARIEPNLLKIFEEMAKIHKDLTAENERLKQQIATLKAPADQP